MDFLTSVFIDCASQVWYAKVVSLFNDPGTEMHLFMKELVNYKDI